MRSTVVNAAESNLCPQTSTRIEANLSQFLDFARWISALIVLLVHVNNRVTIRLGGTIEGASFSQIAWGFVCGFGHHAVVVFFVLSGFLIGSKVVNDLAAGKFEAGSYLAARISRIHLVLIPALFLTLVLDAVGTQINGGIYEDTQQGTFIGNLLMMQGFTTEPFGSDSPLGTLANEFWYYMTFPLLAVGIWKKNAALAGLALLLLVPMTIVQPWHAIGFVLWLIGSLAGSISPRVFSRRSQLSALIFFVVFVVALRLGIRSEQYTPIVLAVTDILVAAAFGLVLFTFRRNAFFDLGSLAALNSRLAGFSYSLYAVHVPIVMLLCALSLYLTGFGWKSQITHSWQWAIVMGMVATPIAAAYFFARYTEARTEMVRSWLGALGAQLAQVSRSTEHAAQKITGRKEERIP